MFLPHSEDEEDNVSRLEILHKTPNSQPKPTTKKEKGKESRMTAITEKYPQIILAIGKVKVDPIHVLMSM